MLSSIFGKKIDSKEVLKQETKNLKRNEREIERERSATAAQRTHDTFSPYRTIYDTINTFVCVC